MFQFEPNKTYSMPPFFGGNEYNRDNVARVDDVLTMALTIITDPDRLADYLPEGFELLQPELNITFCQLYKADFLYGGGYNLIQVDVPVRFVGKTDRLTGRFPLIIWENNARPLWGGREESGQPKIFADIQNMRSIGNLYYTSASLYGSTFLKMDIKDIAPVDNNTLQKLQEASSNVNIFGWRYIPKIGGPGADLSQPVLYPQSNEFRGAWVGTGSFEWIKLDDKYKYPDLVGKQLALPSEYEIVRQLADLPVYEMKPGVIVSGANIMKPSAGRVLK